MNKTINIFGHEVQAPTESMYSRIQDYKTNNPEHRYILSTNFPYAGARYPNSPILARAPGLGEIIIHEARILNENNKVISQVAVVQYYHSSFDFPSKVLADAIWFTGKCKGPRYCEEEISQADLFVSPSELIRLSRERIARRECLKGAIARGGVVNEATFRPEDTTPWYKSLHKDDQRFVRSNMVIDQSEFLPKEAKSDKIPDVLLRLGIGGEIKTYDSHGKAVEVLEVFESKYAPPGAIDRNQDLLKENGFRFNHDNRSKKWALVLDVPVAESMKAA